MFSPCAFHVLSFFSVVFACISPGFYRLLYMHFIVSVSSHCVCKCSVLCLLICVFSVGVCLVSCCLMLLEFWYLMVRCVLFWVVYLYVLCYVVWISPELCCLLICVVMGRMAL